MSDVGRYRRIYNSDWHHPEFRRLDNGARVVRLYLSAGPQTTSVGCFRLSTALAVEDLGGSSQDFEQRLEAVCEAFCWEWDPVARVIWITDWFDNNAPANPNVVQSWVKLLRNVPDCDVRAHAIASLNQSIKALPQSFRDAWKDLPKSFLKAESEGKPRTETPQGSGIREQRTEIRGAGALTRVGQLTNGAHPHEQAKFEDLARQTITTYPGARFEIQADMFEQALQRDGLRIPRLVAEQILSHALAERRVS